MMQNIDLDALKEELLGETLLFSLLGRILYEEPTKTWLDSLIQNEVFTEVPFGQSQQDTLQGVEILSGWAAEYQDGLTDAALAAIRKDHLYLFMGIGDHPAPVWESIYFSRAHLMFDRQTLDVRNWYAKFNLQAEKLYNEPDDHIGLEMIFISHLANLALNAIAEENDTTRVEILKAQHDFFEQHLLLWGTFWADIVVKEAETDFYRGLALLVKGGLLELAQLHQLVVPK